MPENAVSDNSVPFFIDKWASVQPELAIFLIPLTTIFVFFIVASNPFFVLTLVVDSGVYPVSSSKVKEAGVKIIFPTLNWVLL